MSVWPLRVAHFLPRGRVPDAGGLVGTGGDDLRAVGTVGRRHRQVGVAAEGAHFLPRGGIPDAGGLVVTGGDDLLCRPDCRPPS